MNGYPVEFFICLHDLRLEEKHVPYDLTVTVNGDVHVSETGLTDLGFVQRSLVTYQPHSTITALVKTRCGDYSRTFPFDAAYVALRNARMDNDWRSKKRMVSLHYVPVTDIQGIPAVLDENIHTSLKPSVVPSDATYNSVMYDMQTTTNAKLDGAYLTTAGQGTIMLTCMVSGGASPGKDFVKKFNINVTRFIPVQRVYLRTSGAQSAVETNLSFSVQPSNASNQIVEWVITSTKNCIAGKNGNTLTALLSGSANSGNVNILFWIRGAINHGMVDYEGTSAISIYR